jgi:DNA-3-methyladenine glycosylase II
VCFIFDSIGEKMTTTYETILTAMPPFDFAKSLAFIAGFPLANNEQALGGNRLTKALQIGDFTVGAVVESVGTVDEPVLNCRLVCAEEMPSQTITQALDRLTFYLSLNDDLAPFYTLAKQDKAFAPVLEKLYGYHQVKFPSPFENACYAMLSQRVPLAVGIRTRLALSALAGNKVVVDGQTYGAFPTARQLANFSESELLGAVGNDRKVAYLGHIIQAFAAVDKSFLRMGDYEAVRNWLLAIKGIGAWSAAFVLIRGLGRMDELSGERALLQAVSGIYGRRVDEEECRHLANHYQEYKGYWAHYLRAY